VIAYNFVERSSRYGTYTYHRFTHRVELKERKTIASGQRKGFQYFAKKRKYCYVPAAELQVVGVPPKQPEKTRSVERERRLSK